MFKVALLFLFLLLVGNLLFLDVVFVNQRDRIADLTAKNSVLDNSLKNLSDQFGSNPGTSSSGFAQSIAANSCPQSCISVFNSAIARIPQPKPAAVPTSATQVNQKGEYIIPLGTGSVNTFGSWTDNYSVQGGFDTANYPPIKAFYFEVVMHIPNGDGEMKAKLLDDSTPFSYDGQVLTSTSATGQFLSIAVPLISGKKRYHLQLYSSISTGVLDFAQIRIVTQ